MLKYKIPDMSCGHCVATIERAVKALDSKAVVTCDLDRKLVTIATAIAPDRVATALADAGYVSELVAA